MNHVYVDVEELIGKLSVDERIDEVRVHQSHEWVWTRHSPDPDDAGIRYGSQAKLTVVPKDGGREIAAAHLVLTGDSITEAELDEDQPYWLVQLVAKAGL
jgi:hypothetical protein